MGGLVSGVSEFGAMMLVLPILSIVLTGVHPNGTVSY